MRGLALAALLAAAVLAGCGTHAVDESPSLDQVAAETRADSFRFEMTIQSEGLAQESTATVTGGFDPAADRAFLRYSFDGLTTEVRRIGGDTYSRISTPELPSRWTQDRPDVFFGPLGGFSEPHLAAEALARHARDVESEPGGRINGVDTTRFRATVPTVEILGTRATRMERAELEADIRKTGSETAVVDAWAAADGVLRKLEFTTPVTEDGRTGKLVASLRFYGFGESVEIEAPPVSDEEEPLPESVTRPCAGATPHPADAVTESLRASGFDARPTCLGGDTMIDVTVGTGSYADEMFGCMVFHAPVPREELKGYLVVGNVACDPRPADLRERVQAVLNGL